MKGEKMSLLTTEVEISLNSKNCKYYESLGYSIPRHLDSNNNIRFTYNEKILVKVEDLQHGSAVMVKVKCDECGKEYMTHYSAFIKCNHNGKSFCLQCAKAKTRNPQKSQRRTHEYNVFVRNVLKRDNYTCQCCGSRSNQEVHHLDAYSWCIEKRIDVDNAVTLCHYCHKLFHKEYGRCNVSKQQYIEWIENINIDDILKSKNEMSKLEKKQKQIYCITTGEIFCGFKEASSVYNIKQMDNIRLCCEGKVKSCGKNKAKEKLVWVYYEDYLDSTKSLNIT